MIEQSGSWPQRPRGHIVEGTAESAFIAALPKEWVVNKAAPDYGWDFIVTVAEASGLRDHFFVQLKGSDAPNYINKGGSISQRLKVSTVRFLLERNAPVMICVCDTSQSSNQPVYWVWLRSALDEIGKTNTDWEEQRSISLHVPTSQVLGPECRAEIESYVRNRCQLLRIGQSIAELLLPSTGHDVSSVSSKTPAEFVQRGVVPCLSKAGLIEVLEKGDVSEVVPISPEDQERERQLGEASALLKRYQDKGAEQILDCLSHGMENASDGTQARFNNAVGILNLHCGNDSQATEHFSKAVELRPNIPKYRVNLLTVQYGRWIEEQETALPEDWDQDLGKVLDAAPDFGPAARLKSYRLGATRSPKEADEFLRRSSTWEDEPLQARLCVAETYMNAGDLSGAAALLEEVQTLDISIDETFWTIYGEVHFRKSFHEAVSQAAKELRGFGPASLDLESLDRAKTGYGNAVQIFEGKGYPWISGRAIANYTAILGLRGRYGEADRVCEAYLAQHPNNVDVRIALSCSLIQQDKVRAALAHARLAYQLGPDHGATFSNLVIVLNLCDEYEELLTVVKQRKTRGFKNKKEEGLGRTLVCLSYRYLGEEALARQQLDTMKGDKLLWADAVIAEAAIGPLTGAPERDVIEIFCDALRKDPTNERLLTHFAFQLFPATTQNARKVTDVLTRLALMRRLSPDEWINLGRAYILLSDAETAEKVFVAARTHYPRHVVFLYERAAALVELGDEEAAFTVLEEYLRHGDLNYAALYNTALTAVNTGRLDSAISLFHRALARAGTANEQGKIHCQLYELKKRRGDTQRDILRHVMEYGKTVEEDAEGEARFLIMSVLGSIQLAETDLDEEMKAWIDHVRCRIDQFCEAHPNFKYFKRWQIPKNLTKEQQGEYILAAISSELFPWHLQTTPFRISARSVRWPLVVRAEYLPEATSLFDFWASCIMSTDFMHGIHIWDGEVDLDAEAESARQARQVCVDLTALFTLAELDLLDLFTESFDRIILALGTRAALEREIYGFKAPQDIARRIDDWRLASLQKIRVRNAASSESDEKDPSIDRTLGSGVGETLLVAQRYGLPLYSDDVVIRKWAKGDFGVESFSTLALLKRLKDRGVICATHEVHWLAQMIRKNFRIIPITPKHLTVRLGEVVKEWSETGQGIPKNDDLNQDDILGAMLGYFGDTSLNNVLLAHLAVDWWLSIVQNLHECQQLLPECMESPSYRLSMWTSGGVLSGINREEQYDRLGDLWSFFMYRVYRSRPHSTGNVWSAIKTCCESLFQQDEDSYTRILYRFIPKWIMNHVKNDQELNDDQRASILYDLPHEFPDEDRTKFEDWFVKNRPNFIR